jgi:NTE family protein
VSAVPLCGSAQQTERSGVEDPTGGEEGDAGMKRLGLALGGGGVRGFAHIRVLELLDEMELRPSVIAGSSIGAVIGALYASGMSGKSIRELAGEYSIQPGDTLRDVMKKRSSLLKWLGALIPERRRGGIVSIDRFLASSLDPLMAVTFDDLEIPLVVVATDFWTAEEVVIESGNVATAVRASVAIPGMFTPVSLDGRVLVDGDLVNRVPYDHLKGRCDVTIAVDVTGERLSDPGHVPRVADAIFGAFDIMQTAALGHKLAVSEPDILVRAPIRGIRGLDFTKIGEVLQQMGPAIEDLRGRLSELAR